MKVKHGNFGGEGRREQVVRGELNKDATQVARDSICFKIWGSI
jgi:hypothetical protein